MVLGKLGEKVSDTAVDKLVTPDAIADLVRTGRAVRGHSQDVAPSDKGGKGGKGDKGPVLRYAYLTPDRFKVTIAPNKTAVGAVALIMDRRGLFSWRVERVELAALADDDVVKDLY
jgi:hypothetical protein